MQEIKQTRETPDTLDTLDTLDTVQTQERVEEEHLDICLLPAAPGPCTTLSIQRWFYHHSSAQCRQFSFGGCQGNNNNFNTLRQCEAACRKPQKHQKEHHEEEEKEVEEEPDCWQPPDSGPCRGQLERFYFDPSQEECQVFSYSGCAGNTNNFLSLQDCEATCSPGPPSQSESVCLMDSDPGPCYHFEKR